MLVSMITLRYNDPLHEIIIHSNLKHAKSAAASERKQAHTIGPNCVCYLQQELQDGTGLCQAVCEHLLLVQAMKPGDLVLSCSHVKLHNFQINLQQKYVVKHPFINLK